MQTSVVLLAAPLHDQLQTVALVRRRVFIAGAIATAFAILVGYAGASLFARRLRRLEAAAERIAAGDFDEPVIDHGGDEVGQLARTFERMRLRIASLDRARGAFIANASHELRTPLFSLGGYLELMDEPGLDADTRDEFLAQMREQVARLGEARDGSARPVAARCGLDDGGVRDRRPDRARRRARRASSRLAPPRPSTCSRSSSGRRPRRGVTRSGSCRSAGSWSRTRSFTPRPERPFAWSTDDRGRSQLRSRSRMTAPRSRPRRRARSSSGSSAWTVAAPPGAGSGWRSRASWPR